jgi:hypothetical protein
MVGAAGCYFLAILRAAGKEMLWPSYYQAARAGDASGSWMQEDCLMLKPEKLLALAMPGDPCKYTLFKEAADYKAQPGEVEILRFEITKETAPGKSETLSHFVLGDGSGGVAWDPWENSLTVANGKLAGKRIFRKV